MVKRGSMPIAAPSRRSTRAQRAWKVPIATSRPLADEGDDPLAHLGGGLVGEGHREDLPGLHAVTPMRYATRCASTRVLPEPAPARMSSGPSVVVTARACSGLRRARISGLCLGAAGIGPGGRGAPRHRRAVQSAGHGGSSSAGPRRLIGARIARSGVGSAGTCATRLVRPGGVRAGRFYRAGGPAPSRPGPGAWRSAHRSVRPKPPPGDAATQRIARPGPFGAPGLASRRRLG